MHPDDRSITATLWDAVTDMTFQLRLALVDDTPELTCEISSPEAAMGQQLAFPSPFGATEDDFLVIPMNEGILYPADDAAVAPVTLRA